MADLTPSQRKVLDAHDAFLRRKGYPPSQRELAREAGLSSAATVNQHLKALEDMGVLRRGEHRVIEMLSGPAACRSVPVPLVGAIAAGRPITAVEQYGEFIEVDPSLVKGSPSIALRVKGDSMVDAHILDGDIVVVRVQSKVSSGKIAAVRLEDEATVKYVRIRNNAWYLEPANPKYKPVPIRDAQIIGEVTGVIRRYAGQRGQ